MSATIFKFAMKAEKQTVCPLSDPSLGIIPENDHKVGLCLCRFCTCKKHVCSAKKAPILSSTFSTKYQKEFKKKHFDVPLRPEQAHYKPNLQKIDFQTSHRKDYTPVKATVQKATPPEAVKAKCDLVTRSSYANDFPNWGPQQIVYEKRFHPPVRSTEIPFKGSSSYKDKFERVRSTWSFSKENFSGFAADKCNLKLAVGGKIDGTTTYAASMKSTDDLVMNSKVEVKVQPYRRMSVSPHHYGTTNRAFFKEQHCEIKDPRQFKRQLVSRK